MPTRLLTRAGALVCISAVVTLFGPAAPAQANPGCMADAAATVTVAEGSSVVDAASVTRDCVFAEAVTVGQQPTQAGVVIEVGGGLAPTAFRVVTTGDYFTPAGGEPLFAALIVSGGGAGTSGYTVRITVTNVADPLTCSGLTATTVEDTPTASTALGCADADGETVTGSSIATPPTHGTAVLTDGSYVYTPTAEFAGTDSFTVDVAQGATHTLFTVSIVVTSVEEPTTCRPLTLRLFVGRTATVSVPCSDGDGSLALTIGTPARWGSALIANSSVTYVPRTRVARGDSFRILAKQGTTTTPLLVRVVILAGPTTGNDRIVATDAPDVLNGGRGNDTIDGIGGNDVLAGGVGNDALRGGDGADRLVGGAGVDTHMGGPGSDSINAVDTPGVRDIVSCGAGTDSVVANRADVVLQDCERVTRRP